MDLADKFQQVDPAYLEDTKHAKEGKGKTDTALSRTAAESTKVAREQMHNLIAMAMKDFLFNKQAHKVEAAAVVTAAAEGEDQSKSDVTQSMAAHAIKVAQEMEAHNK